MGQLWLMGSAVALLAAGGAMAQTAPPSSITITGGAALTTDYRFRGLSQTDKTVAIQGTATVTHQSGLYASFWASSVDDYVANGSDAELDLIAGYKRSFSGTTIDGGVLYYVYPGNGGVNTDFFEPYVNASHTYGPLSAKIGGNFAWKQSGLGLDNDRRGGVYAYGELGLSIPRTPVTLTGHLGRSFVRNYITFGEHYTDWSVAAAYTFRSVTFGAAYVDTDTRDFSYPFGGGRNKDIAKAGIVGSVSFSF
ncbi:TorF family putative porin [Sphingomonas bacterium]|uniref:TorF family putative porin n=1 Tax=Sphingomonas bacterium TaxID=1895847 RepID=UPI0015751CBA|nr:TorF family putative porin [Sphingomonas bacterium]